MNKSPRVQSTGINKVRAYLALDNLVGTFRGRNKVFLALALGQLLSACGEPNKSGPEPVQGCDEVALTCSNHGVCTDTEEGPECACDNGYEGDSCEFASFDPSFVLASGKFGPNGDQTSGRVEVSGKTNAEEIQFNGMSVDVPEGAFEDCAIVTIQGGNVQAVSAFNGGSLVDEAPLLDLKALNCDRPYLDDQRLVPNEVPFTAAMTIKLKNWLGTVGHLPDGSTQVDAIDGADFEFEDDGTMVKADEFSQFVVLDNPAKLGGDGQITVQRNGNTVKVNFPEITDEGKSENVSILERSIVAGNTIVSLVEQGDGSFEAELPAGFDGDEITVTVTDHNAIDEADRTEKDPAISQVKALPAEEAPQPDLNVDFSADLTAPNPGSTVTYSGDYANAGSGTATGVQLTFDYDQTNLENINLGDPVNCTDNGDTVVCDLPDLDENDNGQVGFSADVVTTATHGTAVEGDATITLAETDEDGADNADDADVNVLGIAPAVTDFTAGCGGFCDTGLSPHKITFSHSGEITNVTTDVSVTGGSTPGSITGVTLNPDGTGFAFYNTSGNGIGQQETVEMTFTGPTGVTTVSETNWLF